MKLQLEKRGRKRPARAGDLLRYESQVAQVDPREEVSKRWAEFMEALIQQFKTRTVDDQSTLPNLLDLFLDRRNQILKTLRQGVGAEGFTFEHLRPMLDGISFEDDENLMREQGTDEQLQASMRRARKPKAVLLKLLFPEHASELLTEVQSSIDEIIQQSYPREFPSSYVEALRLDPDRAQEIRDVAAKYKDVMAVRAFESVREMGARVDAYSLKVLADFVTLFPDKRQVILDEIRPVLESIVIRFPQEQFRGSVLQKSRAVAVLLYGSEVHPDGVFEIHFPKPSTHGPKLPERAHL